MQKKLKLGLKRLLLLVMCLALILGSGLVQSIKVNAGDPYISTGSSATTGSDTLVTGSGSGSPASKNTVGVAIVYFRHNVETNEIDKFSITPVFVTHGMYNEGAYYTETAQAQATMFVQQLIETQLASSVILRPISPSATYKFSPTYVVLKDSGYPRMAVKQLCAPVYSVGQRADNACGVLWAYSTRNYMADGMACIRDVEKYVITSLQYNEADINNILNLNSGYFDEGKYNIGAMAVTLVIDSNINGQYCTATAVKGAALLDVANDSREVFPVENQEVDEARRLFLDGQRACWRVNKGNAPIIITTTQIDTYDTDNNPSTPSHAQSSIPTNRQGALIINKVYYDASTSSYLAVSPNPMTNCSEYVNVTAETGKIGAGWQYVTWEESATPYTSYTDFSSTIRNPGLYKMTGPVVNVLHIKTAVADANFIITEQALNVTGRNAGVLGSYSGLNYQREFKADIYTDIHHCSSPSSNCTHYHCRYGAFTGGKVSSTIDFAQTTSGQRYVNFNQLMIGYQNADLGLANVLATSYSGHHNTPGSVIFTPCNDILTTGGNQQIILGLNCGSIVVNAQDFGHSGGSYYDYSGSLAQNLEPLTFNVGRFEICRKDVGVGLNSGDVVYMTHAFKKDASGNHTFDLGLFNYLGTGSRSGANYRLGVAGEDATISNPVDAPKITNDNTNGSTTTYGTIMQNTPNNGSMAFGTRQLTVQTYRTVDKSHTPLPYDLADTIYPSGATISPIVIRRAYDPTLCDGDKNTAAVVVTEGELSRKLTIGSYAEIVEGDETTNFGISIDGQNINDKTAVDNLANNYQSNAKIYPGGTTLNFIKPGEQNYYTYHLKFAYPVFTGTYFNSQVAHTNGSTDPYIDYDRAIKIAGASSSSGAVLDFLSVGENWSRMMAQANESYDKLLVYKELLDDICDSLDSLYICEFVHSDFESDPDNGFTPLVIGTRTVTLNGTTRNIDRDTKYYFGGIDTYSAGHLKAVTTGIPECMTAGLVGADTTGFVYALSGDTFNTYMYRAIADTTHPLYSILNAYGVATTVQPIFVEAVHHAGKDDPILRDAVKYFYISSALLGGDNLGSKYLLNKYCTQKEILDVLGSIAYYYYDGGSVRLKTNGIHLYGYSEFKRDAYVTELANSIDFNKGADNTWVRSGKWYNEGVLPFVVANGYFQIYLTMPRQSATVLDPNLIGHSEGIEDNFNSWNSSYFDIIPEDLSKVFTDSDGNQQFIVGQYGSHTLSINLDNFGRSDVFAIPNTTVSDKH